MMLLIFWLTMLDPTTYLPAKDKSNDHPEAKPHTQGEATREFCP